MSNLFLAMKVSQGLVLHCFNDAMLNFVCLFLSLARKAGSFSLGNQSSCTVCLSGSKCPSRSEPPIECPIGHYSFNRSTQCQQCPVGSECPIPSATPRKCALGYYADAPGRIQCQQCPAGTSQDFRVLSRNCIFYLFKWIVTGYYCSDPRKSPEPCLSGSFSTEGSKKCIDCPPGYECPQSTLEEPIPCLPGTHSAGHQAHCSECPAGSGKKQICRHAFD